MTQDNKFHVGNMVSLNAKIDNCKYYGIIKHVRYKSEIAFIQFLPIHGFEDQWVTFDSISPVS